MMNKRTIIAVVLLIFLLGAGSVWYFFTWKKYESEKCNFSIKIPREWKIKEYSKKCLFEFEDEGKDKFGYGSKPFVVVKISSYANNLNMNSKEFYEQRINAQKETFSFVEKIDTDEYFGFQGSINKKLGKDGNSLTMNRVLKMKKDENIIYIINVYALDIGNTNYIEIAKKTIESLSYNSYE